MKFTKKYWSSDVPTSCQFSGRLIHDKFYNVSVMGGWVIVDYDTFVEYHCALGPGYGQEYTRQSNGRWLKTGG